MKIFLEQTVLAAAKDRIRRLYDEFDVILVNFSGGKDSTVILNLALEIATEKDRLPVPVLFIDQEAEWATVINYVRGVMCDPRVTPYWLQCPLRISNATSSDQPWLYCWEEGAEWMREKEPDSIQENTYDTMNFAKLFIEFTRVTFPGQSLANLAGVRCEESPARMNGLTSYACYKDITWGNSFGKADNHYTFYPIYDWSYIDVWKAIHEHSWPYCELYDLMYQYGLRVANMRVSNVHHETAIHSLMFLQELEPDTWDKVLTRVSGVCSVGHQRESYMVPKTLPFMFADWKEYRDYLLMTLIPEDKRPLYEKFFRADEEIYVEEIMPAVIKMHISSLLVNDYHGTKHSTFVAGHGSFSKNKGVNNERERAKRLAADARASEESDAARPAPAAAG